MIYVLRGTTIVLPQLELFITLTYLLCKTLSGLIQ